MNNSLAQYAFIPWFRQGLASKIQETDSYGVMGQDGSVSERARLQVELYIEDTAKSDQSMHESVVRKEIALYGPGDIHGIDTRAIIRTEPRSGITNYEANNLAYLEFYEEDFPWRYSPVSPDSSRTETSRRLRPWFTLVVLKDEEFTLNKKGEQGLSSITVTQQTIDGGFPDPAEIWAWAHVQLNRHVPGTEGRALIDHVSEELEDSPDSGISRLICPRKLQKNTKYSAFLIPTFETGRVAGLEQETTGIKIQQPAWRLSQPDAQPLENTNIEFPFYYHWSFHTGEDGDFESLVSILEPIVTRPENGKMPMDIQSPGYALDDKAETEILGFEGALKPPNFESDEFRELAGNADFIEQLRKVLNLSIDLSEDQNQPDNNALNQAHPFYHGADSNVVDDPIIVPPSYGLWHGLMKKVPVIPKNDKPWINEANLDPRYRAAAGLGTKTIQQEQERFMDEAWKQVGDINKANEQVRQAELAKMASEKIFKKHFVRGGNDRFLMITSAMHNLVLSGENAADVQTVNQEFRNSRVPLAAKSAAFRRIISPARKRNRKINHQAVAKTGIQHDVLSHFNLDEKVADGITAAKLRTAPVNTVQLSLVEDKIETKHDEFFDNPKFLAKDEFITFFKDRKNESLQNRNAWINAINADSNLAADVRDQLVTLVEKITDYDLNPDNVLVITIENATYEDFFGKGSSGKRHSDLLILKENETDIDHIGPVVTKQEVSQFKHNFDSIKGVVAGFVAPTHAPKINNLGGLKQHLKVQLQPNLTIAKRAISGIKVWNGSKMQALEKLKPIMAHPEFKEPIYEQLKKLSQDFILPNVEKLPEDSITLLQTNQRFIESYMLGLNHEMARELLWREFPTDQRGSYFRQFWDVKDDLFPSEPEKKLDIKKVHTWRDKLGANRVREFKEGDENNGNIVLVVRGQLLLKYPNTMVYAQKAAYDPDDPSGQRILTPDTDENIMYPMFSAQLEPDIFLFGFDLTIPVARGTRLSNFIMNPHTADPGWFFVFKERPGQIKFGLDDYTDEMGDTSGMPVTSNPNEWNDLTWEHLVDRKEELFNYRLTLNKTLSPTSPALDEPNPHWGSNSADMASILYQNPVIFARHAAEMLPDK